MAKRIMWLGVVVVGIFVLNGCAMMNKNKALENQGLRNKISALEMQLKEKDDEINSLKEATVKSSEDMSMSMDKMDAAKPAIDPKLIQKALKNAGYYQGMIDGKAGRKTRRAIRAFQRANNLPVDGKVGKNTWMLLKEYLDKKVK
jgi:outer membrane murein-binding lipoprotein Lpp